MGQIGLGLAALGRPEYINIRSDKSIDKSEQAFHDNAIHVLDEAYANGVRFFDTAPSYGKGEVFLIEWNSLRKHTDVTLSTKWGYTYVANWELDYKGSHEIKEHSLEKLLEQWEHSKQLLSRLQFYQVHSATLESGVLENTAVLEKLFQLKNDFGLKIGLTTSGVGQTEVIQKALKIEINGSKLFDSYQVTYNVFEQTLFKVLQEVKHAGKFIIVKESLANGRVFLTSKGNRILQKFALKYKVGVDAIAIRFCLDSIDSDVVLSGASEEKQLKENLKALDFQLTLEELEVLTKLKMPSKEYWIERSQLTWD
jgi:aryl-alcohol dehydrogenase-like predicted oxidoreductase